MKIRLLQILLLTFTSLLFGEEVELWNNGRITPEQPFCAQVIGAIPNWGGAIVILKEEGGQGRYCVADLFMHGFTYHTIGAKDFDKMKYIKVGAIFLEPSVEVERFSWSMGIHKIGRIFWDEDFVRMYYGRSNPKGESTIAPISH